MKKPTAFEKMRKHKAVREQRAAALKAYYEGLAQSAEIRRMESEREDREFKRRMAELERQSEEDMKDIVYRAGMAMWGCDLQACMFGPVAMPAPMPPVYGGEPYKMMKIPRPGDAQ